MIGSRPQYGGKACVGDDKIYKMCNVNSCPEDSEDFHAVQCATYNKQPFQGWYLQWKPQKRLNDGMYNILLFCLVRVWLLFSYITGHSKYCLP